MPDEFNSGSRETVCPAGFSTLAIATWASGIEALSGPALIWSEQLPRYFCL